MRYADGRTLLILGRLALVAAMFHSASSASGQGAPSPRVWAMIGDGISLTQGGSGYRGAVTQMPLLGAGMRLTERTGFEASVVGSISIDDPNELKVGDPRPLPPNNWGITGSWVTVRGTSRLPFSMVLGVGGGAYRESGSDKTIAGAHGYIDSALRGFDVGTLTGQLRVTLLPGSEAGQTYSLALIGVFRTARRASIGR